MENPRKYGSPPYRIAVVHGGPGAQGEMAEVALRLSSFAGILEPIQTEKSVEGEITELHELITTSGELPVTLIGHSWGAWLSILTAARYPESFSKLVLVGSAPYIESYAMKINETRLSRLSSGEKIEFNSIINKLNHPTCRIDTIMTQRFLNLISKSDSYELLTKNPSLRSDIKINNSILNSVWGEAAALRKNGKLLEIASGINCPVVAIHGNHDPHPADGVAVPLGRVIKNFKFILIERCGHYPWMEKHASEKFYKILESEI